MPDAAHIIPNAIDKAIRDLQAAAEHIHKDSDDLVSKTARSLNEAAASLADQVQRQSKAAIHEVEHDVRAHPLAAAAPTCHGARSAPAAGPACPAAASSGRLSSTGLRDLFSMGSVRRYT